MDSFLGALCGCVGVKMKRLAESAFFPLTSVSNLSLVHTKSIPEKAPVSHVSSAFRVPRRSDRAVLIAATIAQINEAMDRQRGPRDVLVPRDKRTHNGYRISISFSNDDPRRAKRTSLVAAFFFCFLFFFGREEMPWSKQRRAPARLTLNLGARFDARARPARHGSSTQFRDRGPPRLKRLTARHPTGGRNQIAVVSAGI